MVVRYFNVAGAGFLRKTGVKRRQPTHLIPSIMSVVSGRKKSLCLFGIDYPTSDGSCIRDYVHVLDICDAHLAALKALCNKRVVNDVFNLGNGKGFSVKEVIAVAGEVTGKVIRVRVMPRRSGDCPNVVASFSKAKRILGWVPKRGLKDIIQSMYNRGVK